MIENNIIKIRFTPAIRKDKNTYAYKLDPETVNIHINGYYADDDDAPFELEQVDFEEDLFCYDLKLNDDFPKNDSVIQLFADINDNRGEHSEYIDYQIKL